MVRQGKADDAVAKGGAASYCDWSTRVKAQQRRMTSSEFEQWMRDNEVRILVPPPYDLLPCDCQDCNCLGWRVVAVTGGWRGVTVTQGPRPTLRLAPVEHEY